MFFDVLVVVRAVRILSPYSQALVALREGIEDTLGFWIPRRGFRIPGTGFQIFVSRIPIFSGILDSLSCIPDSKALDSGFHEYNFPAFKHFPGFQIHLHRPLQAKMTDPRAGSPVPVYRGF